MERDFFPLFFFPPQKININQKWQLYNLFFKKKVLDEKKLRRRLQLIKVLHFFLTAQVGLLQRATVIIIICLVATVWNGKKKRKWLRGQCAFDRAGAIHYRDDDDMADVRSQIYDILFTVYRARSLCGLSFFTMLLKRITLLLSKSLSTSLPFSFSFLFYFYFFLFCAHAAVTTAELKKKKKKR